MHVKLSGTDVTGSPAAGAGTPGTPYSLTAGTYVVSEDANTAYTQTFSGDCDVSGNITLASSDDKTCTITNNDRPASIAVTKTVINDNGGTKVVADFPLFVGGTLVASGVANNFNAPASYVVSETTDPGYAQTFSGDCDVSGNVSVSPGDAKTCTVTNNDIPPTIIPPVPPLINVEKAASPLSLPAGPGLVTYTFTLQNIGTAPVTNITMLDDSCSPVILMSGDTNSNTELETSETWIYTCSTTLLTTHTNNVVATGWANGLSTTDLASATVAVTIALPIVSPPTPAIRPVTPAAPPAATSVPKFPNTGIAPSDAGNTVWCFTAQKSQVCIYPNLQ
jgi:hypothetical protein